MNIPNQQERKALQQRYSPVKKIVKWVVLSCNKIVFESNSPGMCQWWIKNSGIKAVKKPIYE